LHQLRGRVGRSHHQAYAYLLTPGEGALSAQAQKRLEAIQLMEDLGSGFYLAMHDLEIRGAGEVLGDEQSGEMAEVGFQLYSDMLKAAVRALKSGREPSLAEPLGVTTEINLHVPALLPERYCSDVHERLVLYKKLASAEAGEEIDAIAEELIDRFGPLPEEVDALLKIVYVKALCRRANVEKVDAGPKGAVIQFRDNIFPNPAALVREISDQGSMAKLRPDQRVVFIRDWGRAEERLKGVATILTRLVRLAEEGQKAA
jgi:transcription-repair coupling factor (superfamily II helicase)